MPDIPKQFVFFEIEDTVQRQSQLHHAQVAAEMTAGLAHRA